MFSSEMKHDFHLKSNTCILMRHFNSLTFYGTIFQIMFLIVSINLRSGC